MKRLTSKCTWEEANKNISNEFGYSHIWKRLNELENILGDDYNPNSLKTLIDQTKIIHTPKEPCIEDFSTDELVASLQKREGVYSDRVKAWEETLFTSDGVILLVCDR